ncbi:MAG TPA: hypothetical protein VGN98_09420 [Tianweitania sediminis]|jgi:hypothetical protein|nr:hypothetical protein [Tianweitania sediminis]
MSKGSIVLRHSGWRQHLLDFEGPAAVADMQRRVANGLRRLNWPAAEAAVRACTAAAPCRSGLCPRCIRTLRVRLLDFLAAEGLNGLPWFLVTVRVEGWLMAPGDHRPFGPLRDHRHIEALLTKFRRLKRPGVVVFGSIETVFRTVANAPVGKPFHLHLMISGLSEAEILTAVSGTVPLAQADVLPLHVEAVEMTDKDFFGAASYAFKQPFWRRSASRADLKGDLQTPAASQLRELIGNLGVHGWARRMILLSMRCDQGWFRLTADVSATLPSAEMMKMREKASQARGQGP